MSKIRTHKHLINFLTGQTKNDDFCEWTAVDEHGFNALHIICEHENAHSVFPRNFYHLTLQALSLGANSTRGEFELNNTPLHWSAWHAAPQTALALLESGVALDARNRNGETALDIAQRLKINTNHRLEQKLIELILILESFREKDLLILQVPNTLITCLPNVMNRL